MMTSSSGERNVKPMKFSEFDGERWAELQLYFDTAILPVTGLAGNESPDEATAALPKPVKQSGGRHGNGP